MENRRTIIKSGLAFVAIGIATLKAKEAKMDEGWLLIADDRLNTHGRRYSHDSLRIMAAACKDMPISLNPPQGSDDIGALLGVVSESKFQNGGVFIRPRWFSDKKPKGGYVSPWGVGRLEGTVPTVERYRLERIIWGDYNSCARATKL